MYSPSLSLIQIEAACCISLLCVSSVATRDGICNCSTTSLRNDYETVEVVVELNSSSNHSELEGEVPIACGTSHTATCYCQGNVYVGHGEVSKRVSKRTCCDI